MAESGEGDEVKKLKLYLDNCCYNRPFDEPTNQIMILEIDAKLYIQEEIKNSIYDLCWSFILDFENEENPFEDIKESVKIWKDIATEYISPDESIRSAANHLKNTYGFGAKDSLHISCAIYSGCDYLITTDKKMIKKGLQLNNIKIINPIKFISLLEEENDK